MSLQVTGGAEYFNPEDEDRLAAWLINVAFEGRKNPLPRVENVARYAGAEVLLSQTLAEIRTTPN